LELLPIDIPIDFNFATQLSTGNFEVEEMLAGEDVPAGLSKFRLAVRLLALSNACSSAASIPSAVYE